MTPETEDNPCCRKRGTLVITIEPCTKGKESKTDEYPSVGGRYVPGLPLKTPRTMEIEVHMKSKDQEQFSEREDPLDLGIVETADEIELSTHSPLDEQHIEEEIGQKEEGEEVEEVSSEKKSSEESVEPMETKTQPKVSCWSKTIQLERKPCSETCPGPIICLQRNEHFLGDRCRLHDPTPIGNQILAMHKHGLFRKRLYANDRIYPQHVLSSVSEISKREAAGIAVRNRDSDSGDKEELKDVVEELVIPKVVKPTHAAMVTEKSGTSKEEPKIVTSIPQTPKGEGNKTGTSGCFC